MKSQKRRSTDAISTVSPDGQSDPDITPSSPETIPVSTPRRRPRKKRGAVARPLGGDHALVDKGGNGAPCLALSRADDGGGASRRFAAIEQRFEDVVDLGQQLVKPRLLAGPCENARAELVGLH